MHQYNQTRRFSRSRFIVGMLCGLAAPVIAPMAQAQENIDFARDVRPILARHCFKCHGPDDAKRAGGLRLDDPVAAFAVAKSGSHAIVPGKPDESELLARVDSDDASEVMPPPSTKDPLTKEQKAILKRWIAAGGQYPRHWAFNKPVVPAVPDTAGIPDAWKKNPIDSFIFANLRKNGLSPQPVANRASLIRRVSLDLTGLPPTPEETARFVADTRPDAYQKLVDRLLASPRYGERWARKWLDLARYADTNGYEKDRYRSVWPYRDWVVRAFNADMPFDQFTVRQLAGDMLPGATDDDRVATGFHRNTMLNEEGGIDPLEYRFYAMVDRVSTTGTVWMGMSTACAQCHNHKYDPITQTDYYRLMATMNNTEEPPVYELETGETKLARLRIDQEIAALKADLVNQFPAELPSGPGDNRSFEQRRRGTYDKAFAKWLADESARAQRWSVVKPASMSANIARLELEPDGSVFAHGDATKHDEYQLELKGLPEGTTAIRLEVLPDKRLPANGPGRTDYEGPLGDFFLSEFRLESSGQPIRIASATESYGQLGIGGGQSKAALALDGNMQTGWSTQGHQGQSDQAVFLLEKPLDTETDARLTMIFERHYSAPLGRFRLWATSSTNTAQTRAKQLPADLEELLTLQRDKLFPQELKKLRAYWESVAPELAEPRKAIAALEAQKRRPVSSLVMKERPADFVRPTFVHRRGDYLQPTTEVGPGAPQFLKTADGKEVLNRLELARWLVSPENPLTARVTVNRQWAAFFGRGLVRTQEDFGYQGEMPSNPELLDWLGTSFMADGWSIKRLHRKIVTSQAYMQSTTVTPEALAKDPDNRLVSRGPRFRMDGEVVRDAALASVGLLTETLGGPSVFPPQPASVTTEGTYGRLEWKTSTGPDRHRRSLYTFAKRTSPFAMLNTFDAPSGEACVVRRDVSNSALQSLTLLNDPIFMESAQALGQKLALSKDSDEARLNQAFLKLFQRECDAEEKAELARFLAIQRAHYKAQPDLAKAIAGETPADQAAEVAAWTTLSRALLNTDEFVVHR